MAKTTRDMAGFAAAEELAQYDELDQAFILGRIHPDHGIDQHAGIRGDRHIIVVAGSRAGKGTSLIIPNLLFWQGGVFCIDPKGENASITAMRRGQENAAKGTGTEVSQFLGQKVAILDPFGTVKGPARKYRVSYNPLLDVKADDEEGAARILALAEALVIADGGASEAHFTESAVTLLAGLIEAAIADPDKDKRNLVECREASLGGIEPLKAYLGKVPVTDAGLAEEALGLLSSVGKNEAGSFLSTLSRQLKWIADPRMQDHLIEGGFSLTKAVRENWSIYVCIPPARIPSMKRWLRAIVRFALDAKMDSPFEHQGQQTLFMLDEFYALGHFPLIEEAAAYMAGYGIKLVPIIQNIGQLKKLYGQNWETFAGNAGAIIAWGLNDHESEKYIADRLGHTRQWEQSFGESAVHTPGTLPGGSKTRSENTAMRDRPIRWANEIHYEGVRRHMRAFVLSADGHPFTIERHDYTELGNQGLFDSPEHIRAWEEQFTKKIGGGHGHSN